jgi:hypothetical protein
MSKYPKDIKVMAMLFSCKNNLNKEEFEELVKYVLQLNTISPQYLRGFISKHYDINKFRISPNKMEDIYVYNYLKYGDQLKNVDLFKRYYDLHLRKIENIMVLLQLVN